ncbi:Cell division cycle 20-1 cofactor of APC complex [Nymphaea thermarum]|nr:Cell division cycle 20-1 cofactor of APC complex [Nymphaea thermarum]
MKKRTRFIDEMRHEDESPPSSKSVRCLPKSSDRILDAPNLMDDYYLNVLDWGSNNVLAVALGSTLYLWSADTGKVRVLMEVEEDHYLTSVAWGGDGNTISVGTSNSDIQIWDCKAQRKIRSLSGHMKRVGCLAWNGSLLTSGSGDSTIINRDVRSRSNIVSRLRAHAQEVCGLRWSGSGNQLASGGNDNLLHIWDASVMASSSQGYLHRLTEHRAAVKAIAWCPYQSNILASGGGTADRCIKMWNTQTGQCISSTDTQSQVCALEWNRHQKEILSSHGYSQNQLSLWRYPSMTKLGELKGHTSRVLYLSQSPDGTTVVSASADETLRFWKVFVPPQASKKLKEDDSPLSLKFSHIR